MTKEVAKIRRSGEITIPAGIRKQLKLKVGEHLVLIPDNDSVILKKLKL